MAAGASSARDQAESHKAPEESQAEIIPLEEQIRQRAYAIWLECGSQSGSEVVDWLQAEEEILYELKKKKHAAE